MFGLFKKKKKQPEPVEEQAAIQPKPRSTAPKKGQREPYLMIAVGQKGIGKTYTTVQELENYVATQKRPVIIFDVNEEVAFEQFPRIRLKDIKKLNTPEIRVLLARKEVGVKKVGKKSVITVAEMDNAEKTETLATLLQNFRNGLVMVEDINNYVLSTRASGIVSYMVNNRHRGQDIIIHLQSLSKIDPTLWENAAIIRLHRQADDLERYIDRVPQKELMRLAYQYVNLAYEEGDERVYVYVYMWKNKILGIKDTELFEKACSIYLDMQPNKRKQIAKQIKSKDEDAILEYFLNYAKKTYLK